MDDTQLWKNISVALDVEPRENAAITGASGLEHQFLAIGADDNTKRLIAYSSDPDARIAVLIQSDIQSAFPDWRVLVARPQIFDVGVLARDLIRITGRESFRASELRGLTEKFNTLPDAIKSELTEKYFGQILTGMTVASQRIKFPITSHLVSVLYQAVKFDWRSALLAFDKNVGMETSIDLTGLASLDNMKLDRELGVCPIPMYELSTAQWELLSVPSDRDAVRAALSDLGVLQYFFPPQDALALGFVERGRGTKIAIGEALDKTDALVHLVSSPSWAKTRRDLSKLVGEMTEKKLVVEGSAGYELTPDGEKFRFEVKFGPPEGIFSRVARILQIKANVASVVSVNVGSGGDQGAPPSKKLD